MNPRRPDGFKPETSIFRIPQVLLELGFLHIQSAFQVGICTIPRSKGKGGRGGGGGVPKRPSKQTGTAALRRLERVVKRRRWGSLEPFTRSFEASEPQVQAPQPEKLQDLRPEEPPEVIFQGRRLRASQPLNPPISQPPHPQPLHVV